MGYETSYELRMYDSASMAPVDDVLAESIRDALAWATSDTTADYAITYFHEMKWYDHHQAMLWLSSRYPAVLFELTGYGEDTDDIWRKYYHRNMWCGGKATIVFPKYDADGLKGNHEQ